LYPSIPVLALSLVIAGCGTRADTLSPNEAASEVPAIRVATTAAVEREITRFVAVTGTLTAEEQADVAAEVSGRIVATPVERGTRVPAGGTLVGIADTEVAAQLQEAQANAGQIEARLGISANSDFAIDRVPEVANARASNDLAQADFERARMLSERKLLSAADFDRSRAQADAARRQYDIARNSAEQQFQSLLAARARLTLARKALSDTAVRAPFAGSVEQRFVSIGDYVVKGTKVASVMRTNPLRVELTVPGQYISQVAAGRSVTLTVDAYPGEVFTGQVRYVSPAVKTDSRALVVEAVVPNEHDRLKPGLFVTARLEQAARTAAVLVPVAAVRMVSGTPRVYVVGPNKAVEERLVTSGQTIDGLIEIESGLKAGEIVAASNVTQLADGARVAEAK
jgi:RND family efflux transporter MFP subunit